MSAEGRLSGVALLVGVILGAAPHLQAEGHPIVAGATIGAACLGIAAIVIVVAVEVHAERRR